jgi:hypothetical protein
LHRWRAQRGARWRRLDVGEQALLVVAYLRMGETYADLAVVFGIGTEIRSCPNSATDLVNVIQVLVLAG